MFLTENYENNSNNICQLNTSEVICKEGEDMAFLIASSLIPWLMIAGDFMASTDSVPTRVNIRIEGDLVTSTAVASLPPFNIAEGD